MWDAAEYLSMYDEEKWIPCSALNEQITTRDRKNANVYETTDLWNSLTTKLKSEYVYSSHIALQPLVSLNELSCGEMSWGELRSETIADDNDQLSKNHNLTVKFGFQFFRWILMVL